MIIRRHPNPTHFCTFLACSSGCYYTLNNDNNDNGNDVGGAAAAFQDDHEEMKECDVNENHGNF